MLFPNYFSNMYAGLEASMTMSIYILYDNVTCLHTRDLIWFNVGHLTHGQPLLMSLCGLINARNTGTFLFPAIKCSLNVDKLMTPSQQELILDK